MHHDHPDHHDHHDRHDPGHYDDYGEHDDHGDHVEMEGYMRKLEWRLYNTRKLEVIWPDACALPCRSLWMMNHEWMIQWVPYVGVELLWQLKIFLFEAISSNFFQEKSSMNIFMSINRSKAKYVLGDFTNSWDSKGPSRQRKSYCERSQPLSSKNQVEICTNNEMLFDDSLEQI